MMVYTFISLLNRLALCLITCFFCNFSTIWGSNYTVQAYPEGYIPKAGDWICLTNDRIGKVLEVQLALEVAYQIKIQSQWFPSTKIKGIAIPSNKRHFPLALRDIVLTRKHDIMRVEKVTIDGVGLGPLRFKFEGDFPPKHTVNQIKKKKRSNRQNKKAGLIKGSQPPKPHLDWVWKGNKMPLRATWCSWQEITSLLCLNEIAPKKMRYYPGTLVYLATRDDHTALPMRYTGSYLFRGMALQCLQPLGFTAGFLFKGNQEISYSAPMLFSQVSRLVDLLHHPLVLAVGEVDCFDPLSCSWVPMYYLLLGRGPGKGGELLLLHRFPPYSCLNKWELHLKDAEKAVFWLSKKRASGQGITLFEGRCILSFRGIHELERFYHTISLMSASEIVFVRLVHTVPEMYHVVGYPMDIAQEKVKTLCERIRKQQTLRMGLQYQNLPLLDPHMFLPKSQEMSIMKYFNLKRWSKTNDLAQAYVVRISVAPQTRPCVVQHLGHHPLLARLCPILIKAAEERELPEKIYLEWSIHEVLMQSLCPYLKRFVKARKSLLLYQRKAFLEHMESFYHGKLACCEQGASCIQLRGSDMDARLHCLLFYHVPANPYNNVADLIVKRKKTIPCFFRRLMTSEIRPPRVWEVHQLAMYDEIDGFLALLFHEVISNGFLYLLLLRIHPLKKDEQLTYKKVLHYDLNHPCDLVVDPSLIPFCRWVDFWYLHSWHKIRGMPLNKGEIAALLLFLWSPLSKHLNQAHRRSGVRSVRWFVALFQHAVQKLTLLERGNYPLFVFCENLYIKNSLMDKALFLIHILHGSLEKKHVESEELKGGVLLCIDQGVSKYPVFTRCDLSSFCGIGWVAWSRYPRFRTSTSMRIPLSISLIRRKEFGRFQCIDLVTYRDKYLFATYTYPALRTVWEETLWLCYQNPDFYKKKALSLWTNPSIKVVPADTLLFYFAAVRGHLHVVDKMFRLQPTFLYLNHAFYNYVSIFFLPCEYGHIALVDYFISKMPMLVNEWKHGEKSCTMLVSACEGGFNDIIALLLNKKEINVNEQVKGDATPLSFALQWGEPYIVDLAIEKGADLYSMYRNKQCLPIHLASFYGDLDCASCLIYRGISPNQKLKNSTCYSLGSCIDRGDFPLTRLLIECGADPHLFVPGVNDFPPLCKALRGGYETIADYLLFFKVRLEDPPIYSAICFSVYGNLTNWIRKCYRLGSSLDTRNPSGNTLISMAGEFGLVESIETLLDLGVKLLAHSDPEKNCGLYAAVVNDQLNVVRFFIEKKGVSINYCFPTIEESLFFTAVRHKARNVATFLAKKKGIEINRVFTDIQMSVFLCACQFGCANIVKLLVQAGANIRARNAYKANALHLACMDLFKNPGSEETIFFLMEQKERACIEMLNEINYSAASPFDLLVHSFNSPLNIEPYNRLVRVFNMLKSKGGECCHPIIAMRFNGRVPDRRTF